MSSMKPNRVICPQCGASEPVEKVSTLYLQGSEARKGALHNLGRRLAPPSSGKKELTRPVHPDTVVILFSCVLPFFLVGILNQQRGMFIPILVVLVCAYGLYFYKRKAAIARFEQEKNNQLRDRVRIERAIGVWMKLYYCSSDDSVFIPGKPDFIPADQMIGYLINQTP
jgi:hypothetical protein